MKNFAIVCLFFPLLFSREQTPASSTDSIGRHEFNINMQPVVAILAGGNGLANNSNFGIGYKYFKNNNWVLGASFLLFPLSNNSRNNCVPEYHSTVDSINVFRTYESNNGIKTQLNLNMEKIVSFHRLLQGIGVEAGFNHQLLQYGETYSAHYFNNPPNSPLPANSVDSLGYSATEKRYGVALRLFYSVRYMISKRVFMMATMGPSGNFYFGRVNTYDHRKKASFQYSISGGELPNVPLISEISVCIRL